MYKYILTVVLSVIALNGFSQSDPLQSIDSFEQEMWVDNTMRSMTIEQKIGQLFMISAYSNRDAKHTSYISRMIQQYHIGGLIFMQGTPNKQARLTNLYQLKSKIPLLIGFDGEWGLDMRLKKSYRFPWNMTLGAIQDDNLLKQFGKRLGKHCKRIGIHVNFAPVVDINTNPKNPIIGNRSFGEDKYNVTKKALAFVKGMQSEGVLANAKHFPGHGDTHQDSHKTLPAINFSASRIDSIEMYPFKRMFDQQLASVMVGHLEVPSLEPQLGLPSSMSKQIVTSVLKEQLGFQGLIFTDGLNMKGASNYGTPAQVNLKSFLAGNDVLLIAQDIPNTVKLFKQKIAENTLTIERLNHSVRKILKAKYLAGLGNYQPILTDNIDSDVNSAKDAVLHRKLVEGSLTLLKNDGAIFPIQNVGSKKIAYVKFGNANSAAYVKMLNKYTSVDVIKSKKLKWLLGSLAKYDVVIMGFHKSNKNPWKSYKFSQQELTWIKEIAKKKKTILNVFTSPYSLLQLKSVKEIEAVLVSYQNSVLAQEVSAQAVFGAVPVSGKLPVSIAPNFKVGDGIVTQSLQRLSYSIPEDVGMSSEKLKKVDSLAKVILRKKMAPGMQIIVARHGKVIYDKAYGYHTYLRKRKVKKSDVYDLASLTKILATLPLVMKADEDQKLSIYSTLGELLPYLQGTNKDTLQIKEVLSHYARLASWIPFYKRTQTPKGYNLKKYYSSVKTPKYAIKVANKLYLNKVWKDSIETIIKEVDQKPSLRYRYSDLGYYILKDILEFKYNTSLKKLVERKFHRSLGLNRTSYLPLKKFKKSEIIPTEKDTYYRRQLVHGYVHDMGAAMQGGVGGHAGLFANANDVAKLMQFYLQGGYYGGKQYLQPETIEKYNTRYYADVKNRRGLGFDKPQINPREKPTCACVSEQSFGHSGFTGTYTWADPESGIVYVFLSNRVYPTMDNKKLVKSNIRTKIQKVIQEAIVE